MSIRSLKQTIDRMNNELRCAGTLNNYNDLNDLKNKIDIMYDYRNDNIRDADTGTDDDTVNEIANLCSQHFYKSYLEYLNKNSLTKETLSIGDINNALDNMSYCSCNSRQIQNCGCVSRITGNYCNCNVRNPYICSCVSRTAGKYDPLCYCNTRDSGCDCVSRMTTNNCDCNGRCSCNSVNEYSMTPIDEMDQECTCVSRQYGDFCQCNIRTITQVQNCECQARTANNPSSTAPSGWDGYCGSHMLPTSYNKCSCNSRTSSTDSEDYCLCFSRTSSLMCECNVRNTKL